MKPNGTGVVTPIASGLLILAAGLIPWTQLSEMNARVRPDVPWAAFATLIYLAILIAWLGGAGPPKRSADRRRENLRLWPPAAADADELPTSVIVLLLGLLYAAWIAISAMSPLPDLSPYPTTAFRWSLFLMGGLTAGVVEEAAFRGYMQTGLERHNRDNAIWIASAVFVASHISQGVGAVLTMGPGLFVASVLYGLLARRTGAILPGIVIHVLGDLARVYFGVLRGDPGLLFVA